MFMYKVSYPQYLRKYTYSELERPFLESASGLCWANT